MSGRARSSALPQLLLAWQLCQPMFKGSPQTDKETIT